MIGRNGNTSIKGWLGNGLEIPSKIKEWHQLIKVSNITYQDKEVNVAGLEELLSDINLWGKPTFKEGNYTREIINIEGKTRTILRRKSKWQ